MFGFKSRFFSILGLCAVLSMVLLPSSEAFAEEELYIVRNVKLDNQASNAVEARDIAIEQGQVRAFNKLAERLLLESDGSVLMEDVSAESIAALISDFEIQNERFSDKRYSANMTVRFKADEVKSFLEGEDKGNLVELKSDPVLVLPFIKDVSGNITYLWSRENLWLKIWQKMPDSTQLVPVILPDGDIGDAALANEQLILAGDISEVSLMKKQYQSERVVIPVGEITKDGLTVKIYEYIGSNLTETKEIIKPLEGDDPAYKWTVAIQSVQKYLNDEWKKQLRYSSKVSLKQHAILNVRFSSARDWIKLKRLIENNPHTGDIQMRALKRDYAELETILTGDILAIQNSFAMENLVIRQKFANAYNNDVRYYEIYEGEGMLPMQNEMMSPYGVATQGGYETSPNAVIEQRPSLYISPELSRDREGPYETE